MRLKTPTETVEVELTYSAYEKLVKTATEEDAEPSEIVDVLIMDKATNISSHDLKAI